MVGGALFAGTGAVRLRSGRTDGGARPGDPGVFLLPDALVGRRDGACQVFPRAAILAIDEPCRPGALGTGYEITRIVSRAAGKRDRGEYTLDVGPPVGLPTEAEAADRVRRARAACLRRRAGHGRA